MAILFANQTLISDLNDFDFVIKCVKVTLAKLKLPCLYFRMNLPLILLGLIAIINCPSHALNQEETYNDVLNRVLKEFDYGKEKVMDKRSEEYYAAAAKDPGKESIGMPGVSPQKVG